MNADYSLIVGPLMFLVVFGFLFIKHKVKENALEHERKEKERLRRVEHFTELISQAVNKHNVLMNQNYTLADSWVEHAISLCQTACEYSTSQIKLSKKPDVWEKKSKHFSDMSKKIGKDWNNIKKNRPAKPKESTNQKSREPKSEKKPREFWQNILARGLTKGEDPKSTDAKVWRTAYKRLCSLNHPDKGGTDRNMQIINKAYKAAKEDTEYFGNQNW